MNIQEVAQTQELPVTKKRLDLVIHDRRPDLSRSLIQSWIKQGLVTVAGVVITKNGILVSTDSDIVLQHDQPKYVSRSGAKLEQALQDFALDVTGLHALDIGLSTGGFTDCLLQHGIAHVTGVDVGTDQVHQKIKHDARVTVMEQTDIRDCLGRLDQFDFICVDVSFISVTKIIDVVVRLLKPAGQLVILIKPQFETVQKLLARGGIVKDAVLRESIMKEVLEKIEHVGLSLQASVASTTIGGDGNVEYITYFKKTV